jgi:hypothetical protein
MENGTYIRPYTTRLPYTTEYFIGLDAGHIYYIEIGVVSDARFGSF